MRMCPSLSMLSFEGLLHCHLMLLALDRRIKVMSCCPVHAVGVVSVCLVSLPSLPDCLCADRQR